jgi:hypothetical protein
MTTTALEDQTRSNVPSCHALHAAAFSVYAFLGANVVMALVHALSVPGELARLDRIHEPVQRIRVLQLRDAREQLLEVTRIWLVVTIATATVFAFWLWSAYSQLNGLEFERRYSRAAAIAAWFVPFANLCWPKRIVDDLVRAQTLRMQRKEARSLRRWVTTWWSAWVISALGAFFISVMASSATQVRDARGAAFAQVACDAFLIVSALLAAIAVQRITRRQRELAGSPSKSW